VCGITQQNSLFFWRNKKQSSSNSGSSIGNGGTIFLFIWLNAYGKVERKANEKSKIEGGRKKWSIMIIVKSLLHLTLHCKHTNTHTHTYLHKKNVHFPHFFRYIFMQDEKGFFSNECRKRSS
jgi:hypothetical protein